MSKTGESYQMCHHIVVMNAEISFRDQSSFFLLGCKVGHLHEGVFVDIVSFEVKWPFEEIAFLPLQYIGERLALEVAAWFWLVMRWCCESTAIVYRRGQIQITHGQETLNFHWWMICWRKKEKLSFFSKCIHFWVLQLVSGSSFSCDVLNQWNLHWGIFCTPSHTLMLNIFSQSEN